MTQISFEDLVLKGIAAREKHEASQWELGDLALSVDVTYGEGSLQSYAERIGVEYNSLRVYRTVSGAYQIDTRVSISWTHHRQLVDRMDRFEWLQAASEQGWSVRQMLDEIAKTDAQERAEEPDAAPWHGGFAAGVVPQITHYEPVSVDDGFRTIQQPIPGDLYDSPRNTVTPEILSDAADHAFNDPTEALGRLERVALDMADLWPVEQVAPKLDQIHGYATISYHLTKLDGCINYLVELREVMQGFLASRGTTNE